jgi:hypothetical protein
MSATGAMGGDRGQDVMYIDASGLWRRSMSVKTEIILTEDQLRFAERMVEAGA